jgi:hypothetical protein
MNIVKYSISKHFPDEAIFLLKKFILHFISMVFNENIIYFHSFTKCNCPQDMIVIEDKSLTIPPIIACGK